MTTNKKEFFDNLSELIYEPIYLTDKTNELDEEIKFNHWVLAAPSDIISETSTPEFLNFIQKVKENYKVQLDKSHLDIDLIFYLWFDEMAAQLRFNFINSNHSELPFGCKLKFTDKPAEIIDEYIQSKYHDQVIPWDELETVDTREELAESEKLDKELRDNFILKVYKEIIKKSC